MELHIGRVSKTYPNGVQALKEVTLMITGGMFIFYNTNVINEYRADVDITRLQAEYEHRYKRYQRMPQPRTTATRLQIDVHPQRREAHIRGSYTLLNGRDVAIESIHLSTVPGAEPVSLAFDRSAALALADEERGYRIYTLATALQPRHSLRLDFEVRIHSRGFRENGADASVVSNGTSFTDGNGFPAIGYDPRRELISATARRQHGLSERLVVPSLYDVDARMDSAEPVQFEAVIGTDEDQIAVAPGRLRRIIITDIPCTLRAWSAASRPRSRPIPSGSDRIRAPI